MTVWLLVCHSAQEVCEICCDHRYSCQAAEKQGHVEELQQHPKGLIKTTRLVWFCSSPPAGLWSLKLPTLSLCGYFSETDGKTVLRAGQILKFVHERSGSDCRFVTVQSVYLLCSCGRWSGQNPWWHTVIPLSVHAWQHAGQHLLQTTVPLLNVQHLQSKGRPTRRL